MKTLLLATSERRPLGQMDCEIPSPMVPLLNRPLMRHTVELLHNHGVRDIHVSLYHRGDKIEQYFGHGQQWGVKFTYLLQPEPLGMAGAIRRAKYHIDETFIVLPADIYIDFDLQAALDFHRAQGGIATAILQAQPDFPINDSGQMRRNEKGFVTDLAVASMMDDETMDAETMGAAMMDDEVYLNSGVYLFEPEILDYIPKGTAYDCFSDLLPALLDSGERIAGYINPGYWNPCDNFAAYQHAQQTLLDRLLVIDSDAISEQDHGLQIGTQEARGVWRGRDIVVHPQTRIHPPVYIGSGSQLLPETEIGPNVVLGSHVVVGRGTSIKESTVLDNTFVGELLDVEHKVINRNAFIDTKLAEVVHLDDPFVFADVSPTFYAQQIHRAIGKLICALIFLVASPLLLGIILILWYTSNESIFCLTERIISKPEGLADPSQRGPQTIRVTHFRTRDAMNRPTKIGVWLENWELYRLPALWNVLTGDLCLVGVQPLCPEEAMLIQEEWQAIRYSCKTGFTGYWYTKTAAASASDFFERCTHDAYYAATRTLPVDLLQIMITPIVWLRRRLT